MMQNKFGCGRRSSSSWIWRRRRMAPIWTNSTLTGIIDCVISHTIIGQVLGASWYACIDVFFWIIDKYEYNLTRIQARQNES